MLDWIKQNPIDITRAKNAHSVQKKKENFTQWMENRNVKTTQKWKSCHFCSTRTGFQTTSTQQNR